MINWRTKTPSAICRLFVSIYITPKAVKMQITERFNRLFSVNNNWVYDEVKVAAGSFGETGVGFGGEIAWLWGDWSLMIGGLIGQLRKLLS
jgi:hypothetical protein